MLFSDSHCEVCDDWCMTMDDGAIVASSMVWLSLLLLILNFCNHCLRLCQYPSEFSNWNLGLSLSRSNFLWIYFHQWYCACLCRLMANCFADLFGLMMCLDFLWCDCDFVNDCLFFSFSFKFNFEGFLPAPLPRLRCQTNGVLSIECRSIKF